MKIKALEGQNVEELSMIEVAHALLEQAGEEMVFADIVIEVQNFLWKTDEQMTANLSHFYTDLNTDGSFIPLGNNKWGLRSWYAIDSIDEETISLDYFDDEGKIKAELDEDILGVTSSEDAGFNSKKISDLTYDEEDDDDEDKNEAKAYDEELAEVEVDADIPEDEVENINEVDEEDDED
ncbi:MAG: DNA-directed RNA polymerase subunit delta [Streptococcaceae bacterium]|jgi:DNA-directed RNA polymerase subunit delta|nr:DNA-directed RNA polymerase subunit delta [Streptococcaceae bacterium]